MSSQYHIERLSTSEQLQELAKSWDSLTERISRCSIFLSWFWVSTWWSNFGNGKELWLLTARDREGKLSGLAPLMCSCNQFGPITLRRLSFLGGGIANPVGLDFLVTEEDGEEVVAAFLQYLHAHEKEWDILDLQAFREDSRFRKRILATKGSWLERAPAKCPFVSLPSSWDVFQEGHMNSKLRKTIRYYERRLEKDFPNRITIQLLAAESELDPAMDFLIDNRRRMLGQDEGISAFAREDYCAFSRDLAKAAFRHGFLRFYQLKVDDRPIAVQYCFNFKDVFYGYQTAYDPDWGKYSPGQQLLVHVFREAISEQAMEVDMSPGESDYKARWVSGVRLDRHLLYVRNPRARLWLSGIRSFEWLLSIGRRVLPIEVRRRIGELLKTDLSKSDLFGQR